MFYKLSITVFVVFTILNGLGVTNGLGRLETKDAEKFKCKPGRLPETYYCWYEISQNHPRNVSIGRKTNLKTKHSRPNIGNKGLEYLNMKTFKLVNADIALDKTPKPKFLAYKIPKSVDGIPRDLKPPRKILFYIHGYAVSTLDDGQILLNAVLKHTSDVASFVIVDWRKLSLPSSWSFLAWPNNYKTVATINVPYVAERVKDYIISQFRPTDYIHLVGHSLGAQIAGIAARRVAWARNGGPKIDRVTGLDPAGPIFEHSLHGVFSVDRRHTIRSSDAVFVDIVHTSKELGMKKAAGHLDIFVRENDCILPTCAHSKAVKIFVNSISRCSLITCPKKGLCLAETISSCGYLADKYKGRGNHWLNLETYFGWTDTMCSRFMNVYLDAKDRCCDRSSNYPSIALRQNWFSAV